MCFAKIIVNVEQFIDMCPSIHENTLNKAKTEFEQTQYLVTTLILQH